MIFGDIGTREATREILGAWLEKNEEKPFLRVLAMLLTARQYRESFARGRAEGRAEILAWVKRCEAAREKANPSTNHPLGIPTTDDSILKTRNSKLTRRHT